MGELVGAAAPPRPEHGLPRRLDLSALRTPGEGALRVVCLVFTCILGLLLVVLTFGIALLYVGMFLLANYFALAVMLAHIRANGIKVGPNQLSAVHTSVQRASAALGLDQAPEVYVVQAGGMLNAFATRWAFRRYVVIFSDLLEACSDPREVDLIVGHEVGHLALGHMLWHWLTLGGFMVPFLHQAYSRAREYSCDRCGWAACGDTEAAMRGLLILSAGGKCARMADLKAFLQQRHEVDGFWTTLVGWFQTHPWLTRRVDALDSFSRQAASYTGAHV